jgi:hypothetical protein
MGRWKDLKESTSNFVPLEGQFWNLLDSLGSRDLLSIPNTPQARRAQGFDDVESLRRVDVFRVGSTRAGDGGRVCRGGGSGSSRERREVERDCREIELDIWSSDG